MLLTSAAIMNVVTRVRFACHASATVSNIRFIWSSKLVRNADRSIRQIDVRQIVRFHLLHAPLDLAHALEIVVEHRAVGRAHAPS